MQTVGLSDRERNLRMLEASVMAARNNFACVFSTADEYEAALITARRAEGRYGRPSRLPRIAFACCALLVAAIGLWALTVRGA